jgi:hypothetical protein
MKNFILYAVAMLLVIPASTIYVYSAENSQVEEASIYSKGYPEKLPGLIKSQYFCGYCHILTYPRIIKKAHKSWQTSKHKDVACVDCHYPPESMDTNIPEHEKIPRDEETASGKKTEMEYMKSELEVLSRLLTILNMEEPIVRTKPRIDDLSCTIKCHLTTGKGKEGEFWAKKINFVESAREDKSKRIISYVHKTHFDETKSIEGQEIFKNAKLNEGRAKCSLCHEIPTKPLQRQKKEGADADEKPITHQSIEEAKVQCSSCHRHFIRGNGEVMQEKCLDCHDSEEPIVKELSNKKLMHEKHVAGQNASCFNCHEPIEHNKQADYIDIARNNCQACHPDHHKYQKMLLQGEKRPGISNIPGLMSAVTTNCIACHREERLIKGEKVAHGSGKACAACHTEKHEGMVKEWRDKTASEMKSVKETGKEALAAIEAAKGTADQESINEAIELVRQGEENVNIVEFGGGVHNKKYSIMLLDVAITNFEDAIDLFAEEEEEVTEEGEGEAIEVDCECIDGELDCADEDAEAQAEEYGCACNEDDELVCESSGGGEATEVDCECIDGELDCADEDAEAQAEEYGCECTEDDEVVCAGSA